MPKEPIVSKVPPVIPPNVPEGVSGSDTRGVKPAPYTRAVCLLANTLVMASAGMSDRCSTGGWRFLPSHTQKTPASTKHQGSPDQKTTVPIDPLCRRHGFIDVVQAKEMMVNDAFNQVKKPKTYQERPPEELARPADMGPLRRPPQEEEAEHDTYICAHMKEAVPEGIDLKMLHTGGGISSTGEHVVPLQHLMEQNPIKESSQT